MAARPSGLTAYEKEREERIKRNNAKLEELGVLQQKTLFEASFKIVKKATQYIKPKKEKGLSTPTRASSRLQGSAPEFHGLADNFADGLQELPKLRCDIEKEWSVTLKERRCDSQGRGSLYDSRVGITCHFCRQKKLCGEPDCPRCSDRNAELQCTGKSECTRCQSANGRFCRACLLVRYGLKLEEVAEQMAAGTWICPHCYEDDHPDKGWICNSSICMTRRGLKPTGIAIYDAQQRGFASVAHYLQARLLKQKGGAGEGSQAPAEAGKNAKTSRVGKAMEEKAVARAKVLEKEIASSNVVDTAKSTAAAPRRSRRLQSA